MCLVDPFSVTNARKILLHLITCAKTKYCLQLALAILGCDRARTWRWERCRHFLARETKLQNNRKDTVSSPTLTLNWKQDQISACHRFAHLRIDTRVLTSCQIGEKICSAVRQQVSPSKSKRGLLPERLHLGNLPKKLLKSLCQSYGRKNLSLRMKEVLNLSSRRSKWAEKTFKICF